MGGWSEIEIKANSAQLKLELGLSLAKSKKFDFSPELSFSNINVLEETKLLDLILTSDLRWRVNTESIFTKTINKLWL